MTLHPSVAAVRVPIAEPPTARFARPGVWPSLAVTVKLFALPVAPVKDR